MGCCKGRFSGREPVSHAHIFLFFAISVAVLIILNVEGMNITNAVKKMTIVVIKFPAMSEDGNVII